MIRISMLFLAVAAVVAPVSVAEAQRSSRSSSFEEALLRRLASSRRSSAAAFAEPERSETKKNEAPPTGPQVDVELLFLEITSADEAKKPVPKLTGNAAALAKALAEMKKNGQLKTINRVSISAIDGQKSTSQHGGARSIVTSIADRFGGRGPRGGGTSRSYSSRQFGTLVTLTPHVETGGNVVLKVQFDKSWFQGAGDAGAEAGESTTPPSLATVTLQSTTRLQAGEFAVLSSTTQSSKYGIDRIVVLASATIKSTPANAEKLGYKIFTLRSAQATSVAKTLDTLLADKKLRIVPDERTNSILVKGSENQLRVIEAIVLKLDAATK